MDNVKTKSRYWVGVLYTENMIEDWQSEMGDLLELPYAYCIHNDVDEEGEMRKEHVHLILVFPNTTTYKHAFSIFDRLSKPNAAALNKIENIINIRHKYNYLIHDTENCRKKGKKLYSTSCRITGNNFDIGSYEQLSMAEKNDMTRELCNIIIQNNYMNFADFYMDVLTNYEDTNYFDILKTYSGFFERLTKANWQRWNMTQSIRQTQCDL